MTKEGRKEGKDDTGNGIKKGDGRRRKGEGGGREID